MAQVVFNHVGGKPPFFDGTSYDYWKRKMKMYLGSINDQVWDVTESDYVIHDPNNPIYQDKANKQ
jgi:hypothetical protein